MFNYEISKDNKKANVRDIVLYGDELNENTIIDTGAIKVAEAVKGALFTLRDQEGKEKVLTISSNTPLMITIAEVE